MQLIHTVTEQNRISFIIFVIQIVINFIFTFLYELINTKYETNCISIKINVYNSLYKR